MSSERITILGAGLAGSLLAIYLARRGYEVDVYEGRPDMRSTEIPARADAIKSTEKPTKGPSTPVSPNGAGFFMNQSGPKSEASVVNDTASQKAWVTIAGQMEFTAQASAPSAAP